MGNSPSSDEMLEPPRRRFSKHRSTPSWLQECNGVPTTLMIGAPHTLEYAIPTVPSFALLQSQSYSGTPSPINNLAPGRDSSAAATGRYENRLSRRSTDTSHPLRRPRVSGSARAASKEEYEDLRDDAENKRRDSFYNSSATPGLSSSASTGSTSSATSREFPLYIPYRQRSLHQIPGSATRVEKPEPGIDNALHRSRLPELKSCNHYSLPREPEKDNTPVFDPPTWEELDELDNPSEVGINQLGSIEFGSLKITNGSPLSMRRGGVNANGVVDFDSDVIHNPSASSGDATNSRHILRPGTLHTQNSNRSWTENGHLSSRMPQDDAHNNMLASQAIRGRQSRISRETSRRSVEHMHDRGSSVNNDEPLELGRRQWSTRATADDSSSVYSLPNDNLIPMISDDTERHSQENSDSRNGPHLSFQSFRNLIRQNRVKSYLEANSRAANPEKTSHQRSASEQDPPANTKARNTSRPRRKLTKRNPSTMPPEIESSPHTQSHTIEAASLPPISPRTQHYQNGQQNNERHSWSKYDDKASRMRSPSPGDISIPPIPQQVRQSLRNRSNSYHTSSERVPKLLDTTRATPRSHANFEDLPKQIRRSSKVEQIRRCQTIDFKPLPTPKPELPRKRTPVRVPLPLPAGLGADDLRQPQNRQSMCPPMPGYARSHTMLPPLGAEQYRPYQDKDELHMDSSETDSPYVSPLSDDGQDQWPITTHEVSSLAMTKKPSPSFQPREVSPIRHARSVPNLHNRRQLRTPAPISAHSRRAQEVAMRRPPPVPPLPSTQADSSTFEEDTPSYRPATAGRTEGNNASPLISLDRDDKQPPVVYRNGNRRGSEHSSTTWRPPYRILHSYYSPAYRNAPIWG